MKQRISHFATKNLTVNKITRPTPRKVIEDLSHKPITQKNSRQNLKVRLSLADTFATFHTPKINKKSTEPKKNTGGGKRNQVKNSIKKEAYYASIPTAPSGENIKKDIKEEACRLRVRVSNNWRQPQKREHLDIDRLYREVVFQP